MEKTSVTFCLVRLQNFLMAYSYENILCPVCDCFHGFKFYNSAVVDEAPETPTTPETPKTPETANTPETPKTPETPNTPETPKTPETPNTPETSKTPETPKTPETRETPRPAAAFYSSQVEWTYRNGHSSKEFYQALESLRENAVDNRRVVFYQIQSQQTLGETNDRFYIPIWIARNEVAPAWIEHIKNAIDDINYAAPGLQLYITGDKSKAKIKIFESPDKGCFTEGFVHASGARIYLYKNWHEMERTSCHELLHTLGAGHEHQRKDRDYSVSVKDQGEYSFRLKDDLWGLTGFDPHSIMIYCEDKEFSRNSEDPAWFTKPDRRLNLEMSELDKVALNNAYRPCKGPRYSPTVDRGYTGLWYCGR